MANEMEFSVPLPQWATSQCPWDAFYIEKWELACTYIHTHSPPYSLSHTHIHTRSNMHTHLHTHMHAHTNMQTHIRTCTHIQHMSKTCHRESRERDSLTGNPGLSWVEKGSWVSIKHLLTCARDKSNKVCDHAAKFSGFNVNRPFLPQDSSS